MLLALTSANVRYMPNTEATIREQRLRRGWTQEDLARRCTAAGAPVTYSAVSKIERDAQVPRPKLRAVLAELLDLDVSQFERGKS